MSFVEKLQGILARFDELGHLLSSGAISGENFGKASKEYSDLQSVVAAINELKAAEKALKEAEVILAGTDNELKELAAVEYGELKEKIPVLEKNLQKQLLPKDAADERNAILEVRAGTGGDEAALFAANLFEMYKRFSDVMGWRFEVMDVSESDLGGIKEGVATISGKGVFAHLKFESGVHRVQRVPATEASGRVHTSAATVAVLPEAEEVDLKIEDKDLRIDTYRSSGSGGQHVNKTDSAVRITHLPTGLAVAMQEEKSQHKNKAKAMKLLRSRLYEAERQKLADARSSNRKSQVGSGDRSERIRTYNYPQNRITDHRIDYTMHDLEGMMHGTSVLTLISALMAEDEAERLAELG